MSLYRASELNFMINVHEGSGLGIFFFSMFFFIRIIFRQIATARSSEDILYIYPLYPHVLMDKTAM